MTDSFIPISVVDSRIASITDKIPYAVQSSGSQSTYTPFQATSASNSSITFNIQCPSEAIAVSRYALLQSDLTFTVNISGVPDGETAFAYGISESTQCYPLNSLMVSSQLTLNNVSTSVNTQDCLGLLLRMTDIKELSKHHAYSPSLVDNGYAMYSDAVGTLANPLASYSNAPLDSDLVPRGAYPVSIQIEHYVAGRLADDSVISTDPTDTWKIVISGTYTEPFLALSPFLSSPKANMDACLVGLNNLSCVFNIDSSCRRLFSTANTFIDNSTGVPTLKSWITSITLGSANQPNAFSNTKLLLNFLNLSVEQYSKISTKNVVPYIDVPRFLSNQSAGSPVSPGGSQTFTSNSIQLSVVPDYIIFALRVPMSQQTWSHSNSFMTINNVSVNYNNVSGQLASCSQVQLYDISRRNHSSQTWNEFRGFVQVSNTNAVPTGNVERIPTTGSIIVLNPSFELSLPSYISNGSLGAYNLQMNITYTNQFPFTVTSPELIIITVQSGVFTTIQGQSQIFTGLLCKETVLATKSQGVHSMVDSKEVERMIGGHGCNLGSSNVGHLVSKFKGLHGGNESGGALLGSALAGGKPASKLAKLVM